MESAIQWGGLSLTPHNIGELVSTVIEALSIIQSHSPSIMWLIESKKMEYCKSQYWEL
jgi:hypothetical protein